MADDKRVTEPPIFVARRKLRTRQEEEDEAKKTLASLTKIYRSYLRLRGKQEAAIAQLNGARCVAEALEASACGDVATSTSKNVAAALYFKLSATYLKVAKEIK